MIRSQLNLTFCIFLLQQRYFLPKKYFHTHHGCRGTFNIKEGKLEDLPFSYCNMTLSQNVHFIVEVHCVELRRPELHTGLPQIHCSEIRHSAFSISVKVKEFIELPF